jgi:hypothetical protein
MSAMDHKRSFHTLICTSAFRPEPDRATRSAERPLSDNCRHRARLNTGELAEAKVRYEHRLNQKEIERPDSGLVGFLALRRYC